MKARLIKDAKQRYMLLCNDGTIAAAEDPVLYDLLTGFRRNNGCFAGTSGRWDLEYPDMSVYPGETIAFIADNDSLVLYHFDPFSSLLSSDSTMLGYISTQEFAERNNKSVEIVKVYCRNNRIPGAVKMGGTWLIPKNAEYPVEEQNRKPGSHKPRGRKK